MKVFTDDSTESIWHRDHFAWEFPGCCETGLYDPDPVVDADRTQHAALLTFGNDQYDRWTALPAGLKFSDVSETFRRIVGTTERQRFETRITSSAKLVSTQQSESENSCCTKASQNSIRPCCKKPTN